MHRILRRSPARRCPVCLHDPLQAGRDDRGAHKARCCATRKRVLPRYAVYASLFSAPTTTPLSDVRGVAVVRSFSRYVSRPAWWVPTTKSHKCKFRQPSKRARMATRAGQPAGRAVEHMVADLSGRHTVGTWWSRRSGANQSIIAAEAAYRLAKATINASTANLYPTIWHGPIRNP